MKHIVLNVEGMTCSACSNGLEKSLNRHDGIEASVNLIMATVSINYDSELVSIDDIFKYIKEAGFKPTKEANSKKQTKKDLYLLIVFIILSVFLMYLSMGRMLGLPIINILDKTIHPKIYITISIILSILGIIWGFDILKNGIKNIIHKIPNMDSLVGVGIIVNFLYSLYNAYFIYNNTGSFNKIYFESVLMIILFVKLGRYIDTFNKAASVDAIKNLVTLTPKQATILKEGKEITLTINEIKKGDIVISKPGDTIAVDGIIINGSTHTDESFITGESTPVSKKKGDVCLAGSINYDGYIEYEAKNIGKDSNISKIVDLVVKATNTKSKATRLADTISGYFVPFIFIVAIISFILNFLITKEVSSSIESLVTVLVVACPCALGLATPLAIVVSLGNASSKGIVIKSSEVLEQLNKIDTIVFDKTGTLTKGEMEIADYNINPDYKDKETIKILQSLESNSNHPIAKSICKNATNLYKTEDFKETPGRGISAKINNKTYYAGNLLYLETFKIDNNLLSFEKKYSKKGESIIYLWTDDYLIAIFGLRDELKDNIKETLRSLKKLNKKIVMLSGDSEFTARIIGDELSIDEVYANRSPLDKVNKIKELNNNKNVLMVGDGINDSPALKTAAIGLSVAGGTDISADAADIIMLSDDMFKITSLFQLGKRTIKIITENLFWALFYNICMIPLATGLFSIKLNPMIASLAMVLSSITVALNSLRLKK